ncbi:hypothetical protein, partial [Streptomyces venezuelae]|uniref:hypothetical protein n=1 Tax=Streptomyces venezuelae TaxID=54571 RepID=UPI001F3D1A1C
MTQDNHLDAFAPLWEAPTSPPRWVIWQPDADTMVFDRELNLPVHVDDASLEEVLRRMRAAGATSSRDASSTCTGRLSSR